MVQSEVFISYSDRDEVEKDYLLSHLGVMQVAGLIDLWNEDRIEAGSDWHDEIHQAIARAKVAVLLITANFLNSEFILETEITELLHRRQEEGLVIFPVIARACAWRSVDWLQQMQVRPKNGVPVWNQGGILVDEYLTQIAEEILAKVHNTRIKPTSYTSALPATAVTKAVDPWRVLVVDDESTWQRRLRRILKEINCKVETAGSYEEAEDLLDESAFDLVTVDLNLDKSTHYADGLELVLRIRETFGQKIPIIVITGTGKLEEQRRAFKEFGVYDFIQKAKLDLEEFQDVVTEAIHSAV